MDGILGAMGYITFGLITKAVLEAGYFKDRKSARETLHAWMISFTSLCAAACLSLLFDHFG